MKEFLLRSSYTQKSKLTGLHYLPAEHGTVRVRSRQQASLALRASQELLDGLRVVDGGVQAHGVVRAGALVAPDGRTWGVTDNVALIGTERALK